MAWQALAAKVASTVVTGVVGVAAYNALKKAAEKAPVRAAAVTATAWGLRAARVAEEQAEQARLTMGDVVAEARERIGEEAPPPVVAEHGHAH